MKWYDIKQTPIPKDRDEILFRVLSWGTPVSVVGVCLGGKWKEPYSGREIPASAMRFWTTIRPPATESSHDAHDTKDRRESGKGR